MPLNNYVLAYREVCKDLAAEKEPRVVAAKSGCRFDAGGSFFEVPFLGRYYHVAYPSGEVTPAGPVPGAEPPAAPSGDHLLTVSILLVHYLTRATGLPVAGEWIAFRELPGGEIYNTPFTNRTIRPMVGIFGRQPAKLVEAFLKLGGRQEKMGHASGSIDAFPMVPVCCVVWEGDDEIPSSGQILFDRSAPGYMETEALVVLASEVFLAARMAIAPQVPRPGTLEPS